MAETLAPAILALLALDMGVPIVPDEYAEQWLRDADLVADDDAGIAAVTPKGRAWLNLLIATPLPVKIERWGDPRADGAPAAPPAPAPALDAGVLAAAIVKAAALVGQPVGVVAPPARPQSTGPAPGDVFEVPTGYNPNRFTNVPPGQLPHGMQRDWELEVIWRDGHPRRMIAGTVIWRHTGKKDDVMAYRLVPSDSTTSPTININ